MAWQRQAVVSITYTEVLDCWFGTPDSPAYSHWRAAWFKRDEAFDATIRQRFGSLTAAALRADAEDASSHWGCEPLQPLPALARLLVLDQFTRNLYRDSALSFAGDAQALQLASRMVAAGLDRTLTGVQRLFVYLPYEHAEDLAHQRTAVRLITQLVADEPTLTEPLFWARRHCETITRFGRFPHRNALLGRVSTAAERAFLDGEEDGR
jgi:uncharacterized protein (DUF924 family)